MTHPRLRPVKKADAPPQLRVLYEALQDTMGIPWTPANWQAYAMYPAIAQLLWERLQPIVGSQAFLAGALAVTERAYQGASAFYHPAVEASQEHPERARIAWELDALEYGNSQLLLEQVLLQRAVTPGARAINLELAPRQQPSAYRRPELVLVEDADASAPIQALYADIKNTLDLPFVNTDYKAMAKYQDFFQPAWGDAKRYFADARYQALVAEVTELAEAEVDRLASVPDISEAELLSALGDPAERENLAIMLAMFSRLLPRLIVNVALFRIRLGLAPLDEAVPLVVEAGCPITGLDT